MKRTLALFLSIILLLPAACAEPPVTDEQGRREIVMAYLMLGDADSPFIYKEEIDAFQNRNPDYFITRVNYFADYVPNWKPRYPELGAANTVFWDPDYTEAYREAKQQLNTDLTVKAKSRKTPDILIIHNASEYHEYARAGVLADLTEYYERDIDQSAVFENFFAAMQVEGKLYGLADGFYPQGLYMDRQFAGLDRSLAAMLALQKELDYPLLGDTDKMEAFNSWLRLYLHEFIDWETYRCDFSNSNFTAILEMAESTPEIPETTYFDLVNKAAGTQKPFFVSKGVTVADYQAMSLLFGGNMAFANNPAENPNGFSGPEDALAIYVGSIYAIAKNSRYKDLAWDYIKEIVGEEYQKKHVATSMNQMSVRTAYQWIWGIPVSRRALDLDIAGLLNTEGRKVEKRRAYLGNEAIEIDHFDPELAEGFRSLLEQDMRLDIRDETIERIIGEEVSAYFGGFIAREKMIDNLNNRVQLYLNEIKP